MGYRLINTEYIDSVAGGDNSITAEIINMFKEQVIEFRNEMNRLFEEKQYFNLGLLAHKAKSSVAIMGMTDLALMLKAFELEAKENKGIENYKSYIKRFEDETDEAIKELDDLLKKMS